MFINKIQIKDSITRHGIPKKILISDYITGIIISFFIGFVFGIITTTWLIETVK